MDFLFSPLITANVFGLGEVERQPVCWGKLRQKRVMLSFFSLFFCAVGVFFIFDYQIVTRF